jgi:hypothetical protein
MSSIAAKRKGLGYSKKHEKLGSKAGGYPESPLLVGAFDRRSE